MRRERLTRAFLHYLLTEFAGLAGAERIRTIPKPKYPRALARRRAMARRVIPMLPHSAPTFRAQRRLIGLPLIFGEDSVPVVYQAPQPLPTARTTPIKISEPTKPLIDLPAESIALPALSSRSPARSRLFGPGWRLGDCPMNSGGGWGASLPWAPHNPALALFVPILRLSFHAMPLDPVVLHPSPFPDSWRGF